jgi:Arc/MetJ-type ribon-helix-helix transcriptional regulator
MSTNKYPMVSLRLPQSTLDWLRTEAQAYETSTADIVRQALALYLERQHEGTGDH